jgi:hypothetical protein
MSYARLNRNEWNQLKVIWDLEKIKADDMLWILRDMTYLDFWVEVLEYDLCNGYQSVAPEDIGALTDAFIITDGEQYWWDSNHQIRNPWDDMYIDEPCILFPADALHPIGNLP